MSLDANKNCADKPAKTLQRALHSALLTALIVFGMNSCYHRSLITDPFRRGQADLVVDTKLSAEILAELQRQVKATKDPEELKRLTNQIHEQSIQSRFPSAAVCKQCHEDHYREWSVSPHAYAQLSPIFNAMQGTITKQTSGTNGDFCIRCHTPVGMSLGEKTFMSNLDRHPVSREGVTCIVCHRINQKYGKISARIAMEQGQLQNRMFGPTGNEGLQQVLDDPETYAVKKDPKQQQGQTIHLKIEPFFQLTKPGFCGMCHDVNGPNGFRLEEAFSEYKNAPAAQKGVSCQDCHMSKDVGLNAGYKNGPAAKINGTPTRQRKITNHMFVGPDYSVIHPGIFPHNPEAVKDERIANSEGLATMREWLEFDEEAGWGTEAFERKVSAHPERYSFPKAWSSARDREHARRIVKQQKALLAEAHAERKKLLARGYRLGEVKHSRDGEDLNLEVEVFNGTEGHGVPTGFTAERIVFLRVVVKDKDGQTVFQSGDLDPNGDLRDSHSVYVHHGARPLDKQLFSLQSKFIVTNERGSEREQILAVNYGRNPLAFVRPETNSSVLTGRPRDARIHKHNIPPGGRRVAKYQAALKGPGPYTVEVKLIAGMVPVNLVAAVKDVGFDYNMSPRTVADRVVKGHLVLWEKSFTVN